MAELMGEDVKKLVSAITADSGMCGFEVFIITKSEPRLKRMGFMEKGNSNLRQKLKDSIISLINEKYSSDAAEYVSVNRIADEQNKFYIIPTNEDYDPLSVLRTEPGAFSKKDIADATGIAFSIRHGQEQVWAYQHLWSVMIPNKSKKNMMARLISENEGDVFEELTDPIITFAEKIDLLIIDNNIIATNYKLLQRAFGFQDYIRIRASKTIQSIQAKELVANIEKLTEYIQRGNGKPIYAKKMMRITDSKVLKMESEKLWENIHKSKRWNGKIREENGQFVLDHFTDVERLIDLLDERYTRSDITDAEYDTSVKQLAEPVE